MLLLLTHGAPVARRRVAFLRRADFLSALRICLDFETRMSTCFTQGVLAPDRASPNLEAFSCTPAAPKNNQQGSHGGTLLRPVAQRSLRGRLRVVVFLPFPRPSPSV